MSQATLENSKTVRCSLQEKYDLLGYEDIIIWDSYKTTDKKELKIKVMLAVGIQEEPEIPERGTMTAEEYEKAKKIAEKAHKRNMELIDNICTSLWRQAKYTGGELMMSISYVCIVDEESSAVGLGQICTKFSTSPIFRVKKCQKNSSTENCCMIFVDIHGRVYATWEAYKVENILPAGIIVAPAKGIFVGKKTGREEWAVKLEEFLSPAAQPEAKAAAATDKVSAGVGLASSAILIGAMVPVVAPIALPLAGAAVVGGVVSSGWSIIRSSLNLADRSKHEQSIELSDAEARGSWLGVAGGSLGLASGAAGQALGAMARNGSNISPFIRFGFNGLNVSVLVVNGLGTINGFVDIFFINDDQPVTAQQVLQLSASLFMFTHSVYNFQTANSIIRSNQDMTIRDVRESLSRNQKRAFDKMSKETIRLKGESTGKADIVRNLKKIPDHKEYFRDMYKVNKQLNEANVKPSFGSDGQMQLNGQPGNTVPSELRANLKAASTAEVFSSIPAHDPNLGASTKPGQLNLNTPITGQMNVVNNAIRILGMLPHLIGEDVEKTLENISQYLTKEAFNKFINFVRDFIFEFGDRIERRMSRAIPLREHLYKIFYIFEDIAREMEMTVLEFIQSLSSEGIHNVPYMFMVYNHYKTEFLPEPNKTCNQCGGKYYEA